MVYSVVSLWQDDVAVLEPHHRSGQRGVSVRPLVDLVGKGHQQQKHNCEAVEGVIVPDLLLSLVIYCVGHQSEGGKCNQAVIAIGLDEIMSCDGQGVNMVLTKRSDESLKEKLCNGDCRMFSACKEK